VGAIIESSHDENGIIWPDSVAPFAVGLINLKAKDKDAIAMCEAVYQDLISAEIDCLYDNKDDSAGAKFSRMDLIGLPKQIIFGNNSIKDSTVEIKDRKTGHTELVKINEIVSKINNN
jgi:prolyl-tRNA synthetase